MGLGLIDIDAHNCMMLRAHQTPGNFELKKRNKTLADHYIAVIERYRKELLKLTDLVVAAMVVLITRCLCNLGEFSPDTNILEF
jgi:hypothetical protein